MLQYRCLIDHILGGKFYKAGLVYLFAADPGARFTLEVNDEVNAAGIDRDGTWYPGMWGYDDFSFSLSQAKTGSNLKPDYDETENGYAFPQNDTDEVLFMHQISPHRMMINRNSIWHPHIHFQQDEEEVPVFEYCFRIAGAGEVIPDFSEWIASTGLVFPYVSGKIHQIAVFPPFNSFDAGHTSPAVSIDIQVRRNDNIVTGDVIAKTFDIHAPFDAPLGSGQQFIK